MGVVGKPHNVMVLLNVIQIVSRSTLMKCPLLHGNIQKETDTEKSIYNDFFRFCKSSTVRSKYPTLEPT